MNKSDNFYIGWQDKIPAKTKSTNRRFIFLVFGIMFITTVVYVMSQKGFPASSYEFGNITEHEGYIFLEPTPVLVSIDDQGIRHSNVLIGYGKFGADSDLIQWQESNGKLLQGKYVKVRGTLVSFAGEELIELTEMASSIELLDENRILDRVSQTKGALILEGEIVDPKCFFGAMKPGEGKIHRSCAIRCLSGGIPPMFAAADGTFHILLLQKDTPVSSLFEMVAQQIKIEGEVEIIDGKSYITLNQKSLTNSRQPVLLDQFLTYCAPD